MHQPKIEFDTKIYQSKVQTQYKIINPPKERKKIERERVFTFLCGLNMDWIEREKQIFIVNKMERKRVQIKMKMKEWMNCNVYRVVGRLKKTG